MTKPLIGITTWRRTFDTELGANRPIHSLGAEYAAPVEAQGAAVVLLPPTGGVDEVLDRLDGLLISGGEDVEPTRYAARLQEDRTYDSARDAYEIALIQGARVRQLPSLAICRGLQVVNVAFGGSLIVDIPRTAHHRPEHEIDDQLAERHPITIDPDSRLAALPQATERVVNTIHHQAVDALAPGFRAVAWSPDGVIEAIEPDAEDDWPFWAVQWHPEKMLDPDEAARERPLFAAFVAAARTRTAEASATTKGTR